MMAKVYKCDGCDKVSVSGIGTGIPSGWCDYKLRNERTDEVKEYELCPSCTVYFEQKQPPKWPRVDMTGPA